MGLMVLPVTRGTGSKWVVGIGVTADCFLRKDGVEVAPIGTLF